MTNDKRSIFAKGLDLAIAVFYTRESVYRANRTATESLSRPETPPAQQDRADIKEDQSEVNMGFIHETDSEIFGCETRSESAYLNDLSPVDNRAVFIWYLRRKEVQDEIIADIMQQAGAHFTKGHKKKADEYAQMAAVVMAVKLRVDHIPHSIEASYISTQ